MPQVKWFLQSTVIPENKFEILTYDKQTKIARLKGQYAAWDEELSEDKMAKYHYTVVKEEVE